MPPSLSPPTGAAGASGGVEVLERLSGPAGAAARYAGWDSALLELRRPEGGRSSAEREGAGHFSLELWRFFEAWRLPEPEVMAKEMEEEKKKAAPGDESFRPPGKPRLSVLHREETRVTYTGTFRVEEVPALRLGGFGRSGLNQVFSEQPEVQVGGLPTWWSADGRYFIYFAEEYSHWKLNSLRATGGDGLRAVQPRGRRSGRGFAHSGASKASAGSDWRAAAREALFRADGWFEVDGGEWEPMHAQVQPTKAWVLELSADGVAFEELLVHGEDSSREQRSGGPCRLRGLRGAGGPSGGRLLLFLPALPDAAEEEKAVVLAAGSDDSGSEEDDDDELDAALGSSGDPDLLLLEPMRESKL